MLKGSGTRKLGGRDTLRAFQRFLGWSAVVLFVSLFPSRAHAYTWMIKHGYSSCPVCHADPSGGELLTQYGRVQSDELLRMTYGKPSGGSSHSEPKAPRLVRNLELKTDALSGADDEGKDAKPDEKADDEEFFVGKAVGFGQGDTVAFDLLPVAFGVDAHEAAAKLGFDGGP